MKQVLPRMIALAMLAGSILPAQTPAPMEPMAVNADPAFEVATIKLHDPSVTGAGINVIGRTFSVHNISLLELLRFAYRVNGKQVVGGPEWCDKERYDISAVPDGQGVPNARQWRSMLQKLIAERFKLKFHRDSKELPVYTLSVGKDGPKNLARSMSPSLIPDFGFTPAPGGISSYATNTTLAEYADMLQEGMFDRPVLDRTAVTGRFDFRFTFMPDDSLFGGHGPRAAASDNPAPGFFTAIQEQLGLKLEAVKAPAEVIVIDQVEKPSEN